MQETANPLVAPGAGRTADWMHPGPSSYFAGFSGGVYSRVQFRQPSNYGVLTAAATGVGGSQTPTLYQGVPCFSLTSTVGTVPGTGVTNSTRIVNFGSFVPTPPLALRTAFPGGSLALSRQVARIYANIAFIGTPVSDQDFGLELLAAGTNAAGSIIHDNVPGFGWIHRASGAQSVVMNGPNGLVFNDVATPAGFDPTVFHSYEMVLTCPTPISDATVVFKIDNIPYLTATWAAGTNLPSYNAALGQLALQLVNYGGNNLALNYQCLRVISAPTLLDTL